MKKILLSAISILLLLTACKGNETKKWVLENYEAEYNYSQFPRNINFVMLDDLLKSEILKIVNSANKGNEKEFELTIRVFVNEKGKLDYVKFVKTPRFWNAKNEREVVELLRDFDFTKILLKDDRHKVAFDIGIVSDDFFDESMFLSAVEEMPKPIGGVMAIMKKIVYPDKAKEKGVEGRVYVKAFIDEKGNVVKTKILKGIGEGCDEAAAEAIKSTKFTPGKEKGRASKCFVVIPVMFRLE